MCRTGSRARGLCGTVWHVGGKVLKSEQVPVMEILKEFRELAGVKGRNRHKATGPPQYNFKVKMEVDVDSQ